MEGEGLPSRNAAWDDTGSTSPYPPPSTSSIATLPTSLSSGRPDCIGTSSGSSISVLGISIATVMTLLSETRFGYADCERRSSIGSLVLTPATGDRVSVLLIHPRALVLGLDLLDDKVEVPLSTMKSVSLRAYMRTE